MVGNAVVVLRGLFPLFKRRYHPRGVDDALIATVCGNRVLVSFSVYQESSYKGIVLFPVHTQ